MRYGLYVIAAWMISAALLSLTRIGKLPAPTTPAFAVATLIIAAAFAVILILAAGQVRG